MSVSFGDDFTGRVNYAARCLVRGTRGRRFDSCFEMWDSDIVVVALVRRSRKNPTLKAAIEKDWKGAIPDDWIDLADKYRDVPDRGLKVVAAEIRRKARIESERQVAEWLAAAAAETADTQA